MPISCELVMNVLQFQTIGPSIGPGYKTGKSELTSPIDLMLDGGSGLCHARTAVLRLCRIRAPHLVGYNILVSSFRTLLMVAIRKPKIGPTRAAGRPPDGLKAASGIQPISRVGSASHFSSRSTPRGGLSLMLNKKLGQHLLKNPGVLEKIVTAANIKSTDTVLEIGPGTGNLTMRLLPLARRVVALDVDERMVGEVKKRAMSQGYTTLEARHGDALRSDLGTFDVCTANLPYQISSPFIFRLLAHRPLFSTAVLMFQKEFAERLMARPGDKHYCRLSINTQLFCHVESVCLVKAGSFTPPPKVDSMVVKLVPRKPQLKIDFREWDGLIRLCFMRKRKTLHSVFNVKSVLAMLEQNYKTWCTFTGQVPSIKPIKVSSATTALGCTTIVFRGVGVYQEIVEEVLQEINVAQCRAVTMSIEQYFQLLLAFHQRHIHFRNVTNISEAEQNDPRAPIGKDSGAVNDNPFVGMPKDFYLSYHVGDEDKEDIQQVDDPMRG